MIMLFLLFKKTSLAPTSFVDVRRKTGIAEFSYRVQAHGIELLPCWIQSNCQNNTEGGSKLKVERGVGGGEVENKRQKREARITNSNRLLPLS